jgi:hypothetical protein
VLFVVWENNMRSENRYEIEGEVTKLYLQPGIMTTIDTKNIDRISKYRWHAKWDDKGHWYRVFSKDCLGKPIILSRLIMNFPDGLLVDHINRDPLDNRESNLRICTVSENSRNRSKKNDKYYSIYKGVTYQKDCKRKKPWLARIVVHDRTHNLGYFESEVDAANAYNIKAIELFGDYAYLNVANAHHRASPVDNMRLR